MKFESKLKKYGRDKLWEEYCGFLSLSIDDYMYIQNRLLMEQLSLWCESGIGRQLANARTPQSVEEFRQLIPLTSYEDYAEILLAKRADMLPAEPVVWIRTTWEGGVRPVKLAPYTQAMLDTYRHNCLSIFMLASSRGEGDHSIREGDTILYGGAPLPFATGLLPSLLEEEIAFKFLFDTNKNSELSFSDRIKQGFKMAHSDGIDYFFAIGSVANYITESFGRVSSSSSSKMKISPSILLRYLKAKYVCRRDGRQLVPGDIFKLKGFVSTGNDAGRYKERLTRAWGVTPIDIAAGTESTCIATGTWENDGMVFFPDACFYEFIPEDEMMRGRADSFYSPRTCLMNEVKPGKTYELVISVLKGGAFMRYRIGDVYHCLNINRKTGVPRFEYVDRVPGVIDIAGFTRITEKTIRDIISLSHLDISDWLAKKEFDENNNPYLHLFVETDSGSFHSAAMSREIISEHLSIYFKYFDGDYSDLKKLLDIDPLKITVLKSGTIQSYQFKIGRILEKINPSSLDVSELIRYQDTVICYGEEVQRA